MFVSDEKHKERMAICSSCPFFSKMKICTKCGCVVPAKTKLAAARCPEGKWGRE